MQSLANDSPPPQTQSGGSESARLRLLDVVPEGPAKILREVLAERDGFWLFVIGEPGGHARLAGTAGDMRDSLRTYQQGNPRPLEVIAAVRCRQKVDFERIKARALGELARNSETPQLWFDPPEQGWLAFLKRAAQAEALPVQDYLTWVAAVNKAVERRIGA